MPSAGFRKRGRALIHVLFSAIPPPFRRSCTPCPGILNIHQSPPRAKIAPVTWLCGGHARHGNFLACHPCHSLRRGSSNRIITTFVTIPPDVSSGYIRMQCHANEACLTCCRWNTCFNWNRGVCVSVWDGPAKSDIVGRSELSHL